MFGPSQVAASISTRVVPSWTSERAPPMTPAIDVGPSSSAISTTSGSSARSTSSSVVIRSPSRGAAHDQVRARDAVEVERVQRLAGEQHHVVGDVDDVVDRAAGPAASRRAFSHGGDGPIVTSSNARAVKRGHRSATSTSIAHAGDRVARPGAGRRSHGGGPSGAPVAAWTSRATP